MHRASMSSGDPGSAVRLRRIVAALGLLASGLTLSGTARADDGEGLEGRTSTVLLVGGGLELVPFAVGGAMIANSGNETTRRASVYVASAGFTLAPLLAHGLMDEWGRGAVFASVPFACGFGLAVLMQQPDGDVLTEEGSKLTRIPFWIMASTALASSAFGVIDAAMAPHRAKPHAFYVVPSRVPSGAGLQVGGLF